MINVDNKSVILNANERNCLVLRACGKAHGEIGTALHLSEHTINLYFEAAVKKLRAKNQAHAIAKAIRMGLIRHEEIT